MGLVVEAARSNEQDERLDNLHMACGHVLAEIQNLMELACSKRDPLAVVRLHSYMRRLETIERSIEKIVINL